MSFENWIALIAYVIGAACGGYVAWRYIDKAIRLLRVDRIANPIGFKLASGGLFLVIAGVTGIVGAALIVAGIYLAITAAFLYAIALAVNAWHEDRKSPEQKAQEKHEADLKAAENAAERAAIADARRLQEARFASLANDESKIDEIEAALGIRVDPETGAVERHKDGEWVTYDDMNGKPMAVDLRTGVIQVERPGFLGPKFEDKEYKWAKDPSLSATRKVNEDGSITTERELTMGENIVSAATAGLAESLMDNKHTTEAPTGLGDAYKVALQRRNIAKQREELHEASM